MHLPLPITKETWKHSHGKDLHPHTNYYVGGNTKFYGAALFRLRREDFGEIRHHGGLSRARPLTYEDLDLYYALAESPYHVHGLRGEDPTEPPASSPYPHDPVTHEPRVEQLAADFARLGARPFHTPLGVMLDEKNPHQSRCVSCSTCDGLPCLVHAKSDAEVLGVEPALQHPDVALLTGAHVERLETSASGREVPKVLVRHDGQTIEFTADVVVASCGAINSFLLATSMGHITFCRKA